MEPNAEGNLEEKRKEPPSKPRKGRRGKQRSKGGREAEKREEMYCKEKKGNVLQRKEK